MVAVSDGGGTPTELTAARKGKTLRRDMPNTALPTTDANTMTLMLMELMVYVSMNAREKAMLSKLNFR